MVSDRNSIIECAFAHFLVDFGTLGEKNYTEKKSLDLAIVELIVALQSIFR